MKKLSTGQDSTLGGYLEIASAVLGEDSPAVEFLRKKIEESPDKEKEEVLADEDQMVLLLFSKHIGGH